MTAKTSVDSVRLEMISDMEIPTPTIAEQEKVGAFFTNLDHLITLHQRKYSFLFIRTFKIVKEAWFFS